MVFVLAVLFLVLPFVELAVIIGAADAIGVGWTILLLVAVSVAGGWLVKREGVGVVRRLQERLDAGEIPTTELVNGALILFAGALMITPGFVTDVLGLVLLIPPTRAVVRHVLVARFRSKVALATVGMSPMGGTTVFGRGPVVDVDEVRPRHHEPVRITKPELEER